MWIGIKILEKLISLFIMNVMLLLRKAFYTLSSFLTIQRTEYDRNFKRLRCTTLSIYF